MSNYLQGMIAFFISTLVLLGLLFYQWIRSYKRVQQITFSSLIYKGAWTQLYNAFGERMQDEELELMDAVLQSVKLDLEERQTENTVPRQND